jgi:catechol 2,3-dioxygenase-like lactoylglutathione lyase family enzyme
LVSAVTEIQGIVEEGEDVTDHMQALDRYLDGREQERADGAFRRCRYVIAVPDLDKTTRFYTDVLGFTALETGDAGWRFFVRDECFIMAGECASALAPHETGDHSYFAYIEVDDVESLHASLAEKGVEVIKSPRAEPWGMQELGVRTVDGHRIMFGTALPPS